ncbi:MAG TPA: archaeosortase/exosortase family protein [Chthoniobacterales bacterium]|nr:archaeosortase/exosortase family protein [Chthoniobacterales bacterium]
MRSGLINPPRLMLAAFAVALWPVGRWYALRMFDGSDEPYGLIALGTLVIVLVRKGFSLPDSELRWSCAGGLLLGYALLYSVFSPLPRALVAAAALAILLFRQRNVVAQTALLGLSLPVVATVQFYLGFPLRVVAAEASVLVLRALHLEVSREGTLLHWRGETILVDAPCSGVRMLWFGLYLAAALAALGRLDNRRSLAALSGALILVITANVVRATALFFKETQIVALPDWTHTGIGVVLFVAAVLIIVRLTRALSPCVSAT